MSSSYLRCFTCNGCGETVVYGRLGALAADEEGLVSTNALGVIDAIAMLHPADVRVTSGTCWVCLTSEAVSRETLTD